MDRYCRGRSKKASKHGLGVVAAAVAAGAALLPAPAAPPAPPPTVAVAIVADGLTMNCSMQGVLGESLLIAWLQLCCTYHDWGSRIIFVFFLACAGTACCSSSSVSNLAVDSSGAVSKGV